jgi:Flp pilus assembly secretin CpaC
MSYSPGFGELVGPMSVQDNLASGQNWYACRTVNVTSGGVNLVTSFPDFYCLQVEDIAGNGGAINVQYYDSTAGANQQINFNNSGLSPRQPWIVNMDSTAADSTVAVKCYFVKVNRNLG